MSEAEWERKREEVDRWVEAVQAEPCDADMYRLWLTTWVRQGGEVTHYYDYAFPVHNTWVPTRPVPYIPPRCGSASLTVLLSPGMDTDARRAMRTGDPDHNVILTLRFKRGTLVAGTDNFDFVACYSDTWPVPKQDILRSERKILEARIAQIDATLTDAVPSRSGRIPRLRRTPASLRKRR